MSVLKERMEFRILVHQLPEFGERGGLLAGEVGGRLQNLVLLFGRGLGRSGRERLTAPDAAVLLAGRRLPTTRAILGRDVGCFVGFDVETMGAGDLSIVRVTEGGDVPVRLLRAVGPAMVVLEMSLGDTLAGEERS